jgi:hypothetical protein
MRSHLRSSRSELQGRSPPIESYEAPQGRLRGAREGFSPSGFPPQWRTSVPHITLAFIPTAGGAAPAAAAQPPIETARGGGRTGFEGVNRGRVSTGQDRPVITSIGPPQMNAKSGP